VIATALVVDDEPLARQRLRDLIAEVPWLRLVAEARNGIEARQAIESYRPDVCFLDVEMPGLIGTRVITGLEYQPALVFTTAFDRYAVTAFELRALDYLLKPFGRERFREAVGRLRERLGHDDPAALARGAEALRSGKARLTRLFVRDRGRIVPIPVDRIERLQAQDDYVALHVGGREHLIHLALSELAERLEGVRFVRIHRSHVVNLGRVAAVRPAASGQVEVEMADGTRLPVSRTYRRALRRHLWAARSSTDAN
jgi:two-component system LytT family response regulator